jgi:hypothetical protein
MQDKPVDAENWIVDIGPGIVDAALMIQALACEELGDERREQAKRK